MFFVMNVKCLLGTLPADLVQTQQKEAVINHEGLFTSGVKLKKKEQKQQVCDCHFKHGCEEFDIGSAILLWIPFTTCKSKINFTTNEQPLRFTML